MSLHFGTDVIISHYVSLHSGYFSIVSISIAKAVYFVKYMYVQSIASKRDQTKLYMGVLKSLLREFVHFGSFHFFTATLKDQGEGQALVKAPPSDDCCPPPKLLLSSHTNIHLLRSCIH